MKDQQKKLFLCIFSLYIVFVRNQQKNEERSNLNYFEIGGKNKDDFFVCLF